MDLSVQSILRMGEPCSRVSIIDITRALERIHFEKYVNLREGLKLKYEKNDLLKCVGSLRDVREDIGYCGSDGSAFSNMLDEKIIDWMTSHTGVEYCKHGQEDDGVPAP